MMSTTDFDLRLKHINDQYAARRDGADAYRDQEVARLFEQCEWTQEKIAARMGKKQSWVSRRLVLGRFLKFMPTGINASGLTEGRFRELWKNTTGKESERFEAVLDKLQNGVPQGAEALSKKPGVRAALLSAMDDGKWYTATQIQATVEESLVGVSSEQIHNGIRHLMTRPVAGKQVESKRIGKKCQYRLAASEAEPKSKGESQTVLLQVYEEVGPLIEELEHWGKSSKWAQAPNELLKIATKLKRLFESRLALEHA